MSQQGASRLVLLVVLFAGFYIDDRHVSVSGIDRYHEHARAMHARSHLPSVHPRPAKPL
jgi:hypothetical protein